MDTIHCKDQYNFIKSIEQHLGYNHIEAPSDRLLVRDIVTDVVTTYQEAADRYSDGDIAHIRIKIDEIQKEYTEILLDMDVYHNDAQRITTAAGISWELIKKMLHLGYRQGAIDRAVQTYEMAIHCQAFDIASGVSAVLSHHYGQYMGDLRLCDKWYKRYEHCADQQFIVQETKHRFARLTSIIRHNKNQDEGILALLKELIDELSKYNHKAESYKYWYCYYQLKISSFEMQGDYKGQLSASLEAFDYFNHLPLNHIGAKLGMGSHIVHALNLMYRYKDAIEYQYMLSHDQRPNDDLLALRLTRAHINLGQISKALKLLDQIKSHVDVLDKVDLYRSYCLGEYLCDDRDDFHSMELAHLIADLYCDFRADKRDRYKHDYILKYINQKDLPNTREGLILEILSTIRFKHTDKEKYARITDLVELLHYAPSKSTEVEILRYEAMIEELLDD